MSFPLIYRFIYECDNMMDKEKLRKYHKEYYQKNKEQIRKKSREWYLRNKERARLRNREYYLKNREKILKRCKKYREENQDKILEYWKANRERINERVRIFREKRRLACLTHYGGDPPKCACCGESEIKFLMLDHINNDGNVQRRRLFGENKSSGRFYSWLIKNNFPEGYQVLCANCNWGKQMNNGICPHKEGGN